MASLRPDIPGGGSIDEHLADLVQELTHGRFAAISESGDASLPDGEGGPRVSKAALHAAKKQFEEVTKSLVDILVRPGERRVILARLQHWSGGHSTGTGAAHPCWIALRARRHECGESSSASRSEPG